MDSFDLAIMKSKIRSMFNSLSSQQQQDTEVINARNGKATLGERLDEMDTTISQKTTVAAINNVIGRSDLDTFVGGFHNMYNGTHTPAGTMLNITTGIEIQQSETGIATYYIEVEASTNYIQTYVANTIGFGGGIYYYDSNKIFISRENSKSQFTTPANCKYIRLGGNTTYVDGKDVQLNKGTTLIPFTGYTPCLRQDYLTSTIAAIYKKNNTRPIYYLSQYGNDNNDGLSPNTPKKTLKSVNNFSNCTILLKSGEEFFITDLTLLAFYVGSNCIISSYGGSVKPIISGYITLNLTWSATTTTNVYKASLANQGFYTGANLAYDLCNIGFLYVNSAFNGKRTQTFAQLANEGEFFCDAATNEINYYTTMSLATLQATQFKSCRNSHGVYFYNISNSALYNIELKGFGRHGVWIRDSNNINVEYNYIHHIGGCVISSTSNKRYGNGIEVWDNGHDITVQYNHVADCFDTGITNQTTSTVTEYNIFFKKNIVERCWYLLETFDSVNATYSNIVYEDNLLLDCKDMTGGYRYNAGLISGCNIRPVVNSINNKVIIRNNICYLSQCYMIYTPDETGHTGVTFDGNIYIQKTGGNTFYPTGHTISANEQLIILNLVPSTAEDYAKNAYALALINNKKLTF